ncbi:MAG: hypothetical protein ACTSR2_02070 [Candidatus Hodarchaeales archaeon]
MLIKNKYHKKLAFVIQGQPFGIEAGEVKKVDDAIGRELIKNVWIIEIKEDNEEKPKEIISKYKRSKSKTKSY